MPSGFTRFKVALTSKPAIVVTVSLLLVSSSLSAPMPLDQARKLLLEKNDSIANARFDLESAKADKQKRFGALLPSLTASADLTQGNDFSTSTSSRSALGSLSLAATLFDGGQNYIEVKKAKLALARQELKYCSELQQTMLKLRSLYLRATLLAFEQQARDQSRALIKKGFLVASQRFKEGIAVPQDFFRFSAEVERADLESQSDLRNRQNLNEDFSRLLRLANNSVTLETLNFDAEIKALRNSLASKQKSLAEQIASLSVSEADLTATQGLLKRLPTATLKGSIGPSSDRILGYGASPTSGSSFDGSITLSLNFVLWDFDQSSSDHRKARIEAARAKLAEDSALADAQVSASQLNRTMQFLDLQIASDQRLDDLYQKTFQIVSRQYAQSSVTLLELLDTLTLWTNSRIRRLKGQSDWLTAAYQYQSLYGDLESCRN
jgi:outer membrane protein TolC